MLSFSSSSDRSTGDLEENPPDAPPPRWQQGCYLKFCGSKCTVADCPYLHDLTPEETQKFLVWKHREQQHLVFSSRSNTNSDAASNSSASFTSGGDGTPQINSIAQLIAGFAVIPPLGPERQKLTRKLKQQFLHVNDKEILKLLPRDNAGGVTSIGGLLHESRTCRPCRAIVAGQLCRSGMRCGFCHYPHDSAIAAKVAEMDTGDAKRAGSRPCKAQRDKYRKYVKKIEDEICADPWGFDPTTIDFPPTIFDGRPEVKSKFLIRLSALVNSVKAESLQAATAKSAKDTTESSIHAVSTVSIRQAGHFSSNNEAGSSSGNGHKVPSSSSHELAERSKTRNVVSI